MKSRLKLGRNKDQIEFWDDIILIFTEEETGIDRVIRLVDRYEAFEISRVLYSAFFEGEEQATITANNHQYILNKNDYVDILNVFDQWYTDYMIDNGILLEDFTVES